MILVWLVNMSIGGRRRFGSSFLDILNSREDTCLSEKGDRICYLPQSYGQADPHLLSGLNSCDLKSILSCSGISISLSSLDICSLQ